MQEADPFSVSIDVSISLTLTASVNIFTLCSSSFGQEQALANNLNLTASAEFLGFHKVVALFDQYL